MKKEMEERIKRDKKVVPLRKPLPPPRSRVQVQSRMVYEIERHFNCKSTRQFNRVLNQEDVSFVYIHFFLLHRSQSLFSLDLLHSTSTSLVSIFENVVSYCAPQFPALHHHHQLYHSVTFIKEVSVPINKNVFQIHSSTLKVVLEKQTYSDHISDLRPSLRRVHGELQAHNQTEENRDYLLFDSSRFKFL